MEDNYYYCNGEKIFFEKSDKHQVYMIEDDKNIKKDKNFKLADEPGILSLKRSLDNKLHMFEKVTSPFKANLPAGAGEPGEEPTEVNGIKNIVIDSGNTETMILTKEFFIKFKDNTSQELINDFLSSNELKLIKKKSELLYLVELPDYIEPMNKINRIYEQYIVEYSTPNFTRLLTKQFIPNDEFYLQRQWSINKSTQHDLNLQEAWDITRGKPDVIIAILDEGVDYLHKDLNVNGKLVEGFDSVKNLKNANPLGNDAHGTHCAGVAAAEGNNNNEGICGIAPGCRILGVRIANSSATDPEIWETNDEYISDGIKYAAKEAHVLSNSWGMDFNSDLIIDAISDAQRTGRNGDGCIICCCAGNYIAGQSNTNLLFPGNQENVITVAASDKSGLYKNIDINLPLTGENTWKSRTGDQVDVCAPGVEIATTDITGAMGVVGSGDYYFGFNGTSASTPHVAGIAALMLSIRPRLKFERVKEIITATATQRYAGGVRNRFVGFGLVDAHKALKMTELEPLL